MSQRRAPDTDFPWRTGHSLAAKVTLAVGLLFVVLLALLSYFTLNTTTQQVQRYLDIHEEITTANPATQDVITNSGGPNNSAQSPRSAPLPHWQQALKTLDAQAPQRALPELTSAAQQQIDALNQQSVGLVALIGLEGRILSSTDPALLQAQVTVSEQGITITSGDHLELLLQGANLQPLGPMTWLFAPALTTSIEQPLSTPNQQIPERQQQLYQALYWDVLGLFALFALMALACCYWLIRQSLTPLRHLQQAADGIAQGQYPAPIAITGQDEVAQLTQSINSAVAQLQQQEELRKQQLCDVSHELRTPLSNIRSKLEAWQDGLIKQPQQVMHTLSREIQLLSHLVQDLQDLALARVGELTLHPQVIDLNTAITDCIQDFSNLPYPVYFDNHINPGTTLFADPWRLQQILNNLLSNAIKHNPVPKPNAPKLSIAFKAYSSDGDWVLEIQDNGKGIPQAQIAQVFRRRFSTASQTLTTSEETITSSADATNLQSSLGLGLAIVAELMALHSGKVKVSSEPENTTFRLYFPVGLAYSPAASENTD